MVVYRVILSKTINYRYIHLLLSLKVPKIKVKHLRNKRRKAFEEYLNAVCKDKEEKIEKYKRREERLVRILKENKQTIKGLKQRIDKGSEHPLYNYAIFYKLAIASSVYFIYILLHLLLYDLEPLLFYFPVVPDGNRYIGTWLITVSFIYVSILLAGIEGFYLPLLIAFKTVNFYPVRLFPLLYYLTAPLTNAIISLVYPTKGLYL